MCNRRSLTVVLMVLALSLVFPFESSIYGALFQKCGMPTVVGFGTKPNMMIVMDYSGSMQFPAYVDDNFSSYYSSYVANCYNTSQSGVYDRQTSYYGTFDSDVYYVYDTDNNWFEAAATQPVTWKTTTAPSEDGGSGTRIKFTAPGHGFAVNDVVVFKDLTSHEGFNGKAFLVASVSGSTFTIYATWDSKPDKAGGKVIKRVEGSFDSANGISGNILNFVATTRIDAALKALIGGKADCDDTYCYLRNQGARRFINETTNLNAKFYVRPATLTSGGTVQTFPDDYSTGSYHDKDVFITVYQRYYGRLDSSDPIYYRKYFELWKFTLTTKTRVRFELNGTYSGSANDQLEIYSAPISSMGSCSSSKGDTSNRVMYSTGNPATIDTDLNAGTYYLSCTSQSTSCRTGSYDLWSTVPLQPYEPGGNENSHNGQSLTTIGSIPSARIYLRVAKAKRQGVIQKANPYVRFGFMYYKSDSGKQGKIAVGCHRDPDVSDEDQLRKLVNAFQGIHENLDAESQYHYTSGDPYTEILPYNGTPTGEALDEAKEYFQQVTGTNNANNSYYISKGSIKDPYYNTGPSGTPVAAPCRDSFVLLISDGEWNGSVDPDGEAYTMHTSDLRTDLDDKQTVGVYSIFAFSQAEAGMNSMKAVAMYGNFTDRSGCTDNWPYTVSSYSSSSLSLSWPRSTCNPNGTYSDNCCKEWDNIWDRDGDGVLEDKGVPDAFFAASNGAELETALMAVLQDVVTRNAAASAVATVSQQGADGDLIVRGAFEASDPDVVDKYLWRGHIDAYWPLGVKESIYGGSRVVEEPVYEFGCPRALGLLCHQIKEEDFVSGTDCPERQVVGETARCIDFANPLTEPSLRKVITGYDTNGDGVIRYATSSGGSSITLEKEQADFSVDNLSWLEPLLALDSDFTGDGLTNTADARALIEWLLGEEKDATYFRSRTDKNSKTWVVGDVVFSTPVIVGVPPFAGVLTVDPDIREYYRYRNEKVRNLTHPPDPIPSAPTIEEVVKKVVYVGTNAGVLHCFVLGVWNWERQLWVYKRESELNVNDDDAAADKESDRKYAKYVGRELWSYIPSNLLSELKELARTSYGDNVVGACKHRTMVDLAPVPWQVYMRYLDDDGQVQEGWRTVIVGGERGGGDLYFAFDVSNPDKPVLLWEYSILKDLIRATGTSTYELPSDFSIHYNELKLLPLAWSQPYVGRLNLPEDGTLSFFTGNPNSSGAATGEFPFTGKRHIAFAGGSFRVFDESLSFNSGFNMPSDLMVLLRQPHFMALDIETGENLFKYVWPNLLKRFSAIADMYDDDAEERKHPSTGTTVTHIPQALGSPMAYDLLNGEEPGRDGFTDHIYVGDMNGYFYGMKFNFIGSTKGMKVDVWLTKFATAGSSAPENLYRSAAEPITVAPAASREGHVAIDEGRSLLGSGDPDYIRVIFGSGKYDTTDIGDDDKTDGAKMTLYNLRDKMELPTISSSGAGSLLGGQVVPGSGFNVNVELKCGQPWAQEHMFQDNCTWTKAANGEPDCCQNSCESPCWSCVYDLTHPTDSDVNPAEREINKVAISNGWVYVTTYQPPSDTCAAFGPGYLYIFDYMCRSFRREDSPLDIAQAEDIAPHTNAQGDSVVAGLMVDLTQIDGGAPGVPSPPVLDSSGAVIIQLSNASIIRIPPDPGGRTPPIEGWRER